MLDITDQLLQKMETQDIMDYDLFDLNGKNYCPVDGIISLKEFVDNDNAINFYSYVKRAKLIRKIIKNHGHRVAVEFELSLQQKNSNKSGPSVVCIWLLEISNENKITVIDSYWDVAKFKKDLELNHPDFIKLFFKNGSAK